MSPPVSATITCAVRGPIPGMVTRRARQPPRIAFPGDQRLDHLPPRDARQLRGHRVDLDAVLEQLLAVPRTRPQRRSLLARDENGPQQSVLVQLSDPLAVPGRFSGPGHYACAPHCTRTPRPPR